MFALTPLSFFWVGTEAQPRGRDVCNKDTERAEMKIVPRQELCRGFGIVSRDLSDENRSSQP